jgi:transcriptional regulator with GAF, ATPase, and Fis domain
VGAADGGTLFLDEVGELDLAVQAKLLRVLETRSVEPLGATRPRVVDLRVCAATTREPRADVLAGRFREDLYFRIDRPEVHLPPLRERRDEIPHLVQAFLAEVANPGARLELRPSLVEACLSRPWPGNVRELRGEIRAAALEAIAAGRTAVGRVDLPAGAGLSLAARRSTPPTLVSDGPSDDDDDDPRRAPLSSEDRAAAEAALRTAAEAALRSDGGNVNRAARRLGWTRARLRRVIDRHGIDVERLRRPEEQ